MASLLHVYVCMFVCEPVSIVFFFFLAFLYRESAWAQISSLLQLVYLPMQQITDATVFLAASFFFFCVGAHAVFAKVLRQEVVHCVCMYVFLCSFLSREHLIWLLVLFSSVFLLIFPPLLFFFFKFQHVCIYDVMHGVHNHLCPIARVVSLRILLIDPHTLIHMRNLYFCASRRHGLLRR